MKVGEFVLDPRLHADTVHVLSLPLCEVRLMNDARYAWLILVPRHPDATEVLDLPAEPQAMMWHEVGYVSAALRASVPCDKLNIGTLGNIVRQLHVHVIARSEGDAAWPGPVWGYGRAEPYAEDQRQTRLQQLRKAINAMHVPASG